MLKDLEWVSLDDRWKHQLLLMTFKGPLDNIFTFSFWLYFIYQVNIIHKSKKKNSKILKVKKSSIFSMHKVGMRLICIHVTVQNMVKILNQNVIIYVMFSYFLYLFKELHKQALKFFLQTRTMVVGTKFNSRDSGSHF